MKSFSRLALFLIIPLIGVFCLKLIFDQQNNNPALAQSLPDLEWPQIQHDAQHTGRTEASVPPKVGCANNDSNKYRQNECYFLEWGWVDDEHLVQNFISDPGNSITDGFEGDFEFEVIFSQQVQPIIAGGKTYFGAMNGTMYAVDALTGQASWQYATNGPILGTAAYIDGTVVFGSMDGKIYAINASNGNLRWSYQTGAGVSSAPVVDNGMVYIGSRDGKFYAFYINGDGTPIWTYTTAASEDDNQAFSKAPIISVAAVSEDGSTVLFGAENMYFYALDTSNGKERWKKKLIGQSFQYTWPVIKDGKAIVRTISSGLSAERDWNPHVKELEDLDEYWGGMPDNASWEEEKSRINTWLDKYPIEQTMYIFNVETGAETDAAMGRVSGDNYPPHAPVLAFSASLPGARRINDPLLTYWRVKEATFFQSGTGCFGTHYCPDLGPIDLNTGDRIKLATPSSRFKPELDNGFVMTVGGNYLYLYNGFRGARAIRLTNVDGEYGKNIYMTARFATWDNYDGRGAAITYFGNDANPNIDLRPPKIHLEPAGYNGIAIARINGKSRLYINEARTGVISSISSD